MNVRVRDVYKISVGELSMYQSYDIVNKIKSLCAKYNLGYSLDKKDPFFGAKVVAVFEGSSEDIALVVKLLKVDFKVRKL